MWTCPKCGRAFKKQGQSHYCGAGGNTAVSERSKGCVACGTAGGRGTDFMEYADLLEEA